MRIENLSKEVDMAAVRGGVNTAQGNNMLTSIGSVSVNALAGGPGLVGPIVGVTNQPTVYGQQSNANSTLVETQISQTALGLFGSSATVW
jgi:hypothetical protein